MSAIEFVFPSFTTKVTGYVPPAVYTWVGLTPVAVAPSPKFHM